MKRSLRITALLMILCAGCVAAKVKVYSLNGDPVYAGEFGKRYVLIRDCYIYEDSSIPDREISARVTRPVAGQGELPDMVTTANIGRRYGVLKILGVAPSGTAFRVSRVVREETPLGWYVNYEIQLNDGTMLSAMSLLDRPKGAGSKVTISPIFAKEDGG